MSDYGLDEDSPPQQQIGGDDAHNLSTDDPTNAANNSIIGKVKSRVSSILPNRLSKWFSPSTKLRNDELNGSLSSTNKARRRRRIEVDDDEEEADEEADEDEARRRRGEYEQQNHNMRSSKRDEHSEAEDDDEDEDDESQNSEEEYNATLAAQKTRNDILGRQPPAKRTRLNIDMRDSPLIAARRPLVSSTPAISSTYSRNSIGTATVSRSSYQRFTNLNLYANQNKKEPAYNFSSCQQKDSSSPKINTDIIDLISNPPNENEDKIAAQSNIYSRPGISSRRSLNIPSSSSSSRTGAERLLATVSHLKRQSSTTKADISSLSPSGSTLGGVPPRRTSTTIHEIKDSAEHSESGEQEEDTESNLLKHNGQIKEETNSYKRIKRQKHVNGSGLNTTTTVSADIPEENEAILLDTASESGESGAAAELTKSKPERKTGLFSTSVATGTTRNSSRTSSFGNGLNFYSHLEGRKSLFTTGGTGHGISNQLNNSTLSLTSLNRRQFNASIYGSTSALSDSRLLNTFSPFYKGKTTYGGAAAYNKYAAGAGASAVRITPTLIRPTSSLSTLSSSNNSLATNANAQQIGESSTISSTAKRILDLINDFATPLSEAKKMASNLKANAQLQMPPQARGRLNDSDLNNSRAMRLSQVRTPYARPAVILQPSGNANNGGVAGRGPMPPVKELQVPTMSQLLQMKKIQNTTERARNITRNSAVATNSEVIEYTLPIAAAASSAVGGSMGVDNSKMHQSSSGANEIEQLQVQQKHTNKMKNKVTATSRISAASKDLLDESPPPSVILPNIAFPLMQSVPKFDIQFSTSTTPSAITSSAATTSAINSKKSLQITQTAFNTKPASSSDYSSNKGASEISKSPSCIFSSGSTTSSVNFKFSEPLVVKGLNTPTQNIAPTNLDNYKFSPPLEVTPKTTQKQQAKPQQPQLKSGSCLDVLNKPLTLPEATKSSNTSSTSPLIANSFGDQFKKSSNEWECEACMIRNKASVSKCVACETPRKVASAAAATAPTVFISSSAGLGGSNFGQQFKKASTEWECDTCMIRNKEANTKCVACETPRKGLTSSSSSFLSMGGPSLPPIKNSFGDAFKPKTGTWECSTCMISNKSEANECVACQTKKPGASSSTSAPSSSSTANPASKFKFGFASAQTTKGADASSDAGFKSIAAQQKASKWECDACMTRNDAERTKCACCEQPKPGAANIESCSATTTKFSFGATAAAKFSFGFGPGSNAPKEEDLRKEKNSTQTEEKKNTAGTAITSNTTTLSTTGFQFGIKPNMALTQESKKDETDAKNTTVAGFKFGAPSSGEAIKKTESSTLATTSLATTGFTFGAKAAIATTTNITSAITTTPATTSAPSAGGSPSVKFSLPSATNPTASSSSSLSSSAQPTFSFGSKNPASSTTEGFSFGSAAKKPTEEKKPSMDGFAFKTPAAVSSSSTPTFAFGSPSASQTSAATTSSTLSNLPAATTSSTSLATTATVKPMFSFGSNTTTSNANTSTNPLTTTTTASTGFGGFSFGSTTTAATGADKPLFGAVTSTSSTTTAAASAASLNSSTKPAAATNLFGSFGGATASATPTFGSSSSSSAAATPASNSTTVSSSTNNNSSNVTPTFGSFGSVSSTPATTNVFGSFGGSSQKPTAPVFGNVASSSSSTQPVVASPKAFVFGSANTTTTPQPATTSTATALSLGSGTASNAWSKTSFVFGSGAVAGSASTTPANSNKDAPKPSLFGAFGAAANNSNQQQTTSIFGNPAAPSASANTTSPPAPVFGSTTASTANSGSTNLFGVNSAPAAPTTNIFGSNPSGNAATPAPAFGSSPFGGSASSTSATPTFGSTAVTGSATFGGFGSTIGNTTNAAEIKKPEPAFNFGSSAQTTQQSNSGGFNFGSTSAPNKPAFNFGGTGAAPQPTFNFTGSSENSAKPFQFGAIPSAPVFNFGGGAIETTPNAPFQFNAGTAPVSSNIFAPAPTPGAQTAQQAKRKIRAPIRRVTQR